MNHPPYIKVTQDKFPQRFSRYEISYEELPMDIRERLEEGCINTEWSTLESEIKRNVSLDISPYVCTVILKDVCIRTSK